MRINLNLGWEQAEEVAMQVVRDDLETFEGYVRSYKNKEAIVPVFDPDPRVDLQLLKQRVKACKRILDWHGEKVNG